MDKPNKRPVANPAFKLLLASLTAMSAFSLNAQVEPPLPPAATESTAESPAPDDEVVKLESFSVTGSNIKRMDQEKVLPVTVFSYDQIQARDAVTPVDLLIGLPQITNIPANETSTNAVAARGGNAAVALRGIGASNTLVLLNGRRLPYNPFSGSPPTSTVNVNSLPSTGIQQVEVLRDGASAVYGSDAVAGVVNYITDTEAKGGSTSLRYGVTEHGGGMDIQGNFNYGFLFAEGRGKWLVSATAYNRDAIYFKEREISKSSNRLDEARAPWNIVGSVYDGRTATSQYPSFRLGSDVITGTVNWFYPTGAAAPALTTTALPRELYADYNEYTIGQPMTARANLYNKIEFELTPSLTVFGEAIGYISKSQTGRQPITLNASDARVTLSVDNPYNPYGSRFNQLGVTDGSKVNRAPTAITMNSVLFMDGGPEKITAEDRMYRIMGGLRGKIGTTTWNWETAATLGGYSVQDFSVNAIRESQIKAAAQRTDASAWNPFGYTFKVVNGAVVADQAYVNPKSVRDTYTQSANRYGHSKLASWDARLNGTVAEIWSGPIAVSVGGEARWEFKEEHKDPFVSTNPPGSGLDPDNNDVLVTSPKYDYDADRTVYSAYAETVIPLIAPKNNIPGANTLEFNASARFESYSDFGETTKPKFGINWKPVSWVMLRGSINKGFRAPDLAAMYQPTSFTVASPPGNRDVVRNNYFIGANQAVDAQVLNRTYSLPNPTLGAEESEGKSAGIAVDIPGVKGLSVTLDYWEIEQKNLIISRTRETAQDEALLRAYTQAQLAAGVNIMDINVGSRTTPTGANTYKGDPYTLRAAPTADDYARFAATYATLPQSQWIAPLGQWLGATTELINGTGQNFTNGLDYGVTYNLPRMSIGQFRVSTEWSQFFDKYTQQSPTSPIDDDVVAMLLPEWKSSTTVQWKNKGWGATLNATYQSDIRTNATTNLTSYNNAGQPSYIRVVANNGQTFYYEEGQDQLQVNVGVSYRFGKDVNFWLRDTTFRLGINNILDEDPALIAATEAGTGANASGYSGGTGTSLWVGRAYSFTISRDF